MLNIKKMVLVCTLGTLASCGSQNATEFKSAELKKSTEIKQSAEAPLSLSDATTSYCPAGTTLLTSHWMCVSATDALGPFSPDMIAKCKAAQGGDAVCDGSKWSLEFAKQLRGIGQCPVGTTFDTTLQECRSGDNIYGPFSKELVEHCRLIGGKDSCELMRWNKYFAESFKGKPASGQSLNVPYFYQYNNVNQPGSTCNITSVAMIAQYYGIAVTPDQIYNRTGGPVYTGDDMIWAAGLYGLKGTFSENANVAKIKGFIDAGRPVILQGWFTGSGHIMVIEGYDSTGWIMNDPAGKWAGCYKCGYVSSTSSSGKGIHYSYEAVADAATDSGNPNSYWITVLSK